MSELLLVPMLSQTSITALQTLGVAALVFLGQYVVAKLSNKAATRSSQVDSQAKATEAWQEYATEMKSRMDALEERLGRAESRVRILEAQGARDFDLIRRLVRRLRACFKCIESLGGDIPPEDRELADLADLRVNGELTPKE